MVQVYAPADPVAIGGVDGAHLRERRFDVRTANGFEIESERLEGTAAGGGSGTLSSGKKTAATFSPSPMHWPGP